MTADTASAPSDPGRSATGLLAAVACAGAATLVIELAAVRLLAPWFGASSGVWTNVIGVILLALALGYLAGARLAQKPRPERILGWVLLGCGALGAALPALAAPVCNRFLPSGMRLDSAANLWMWGSLAASLLLFLPPAALLGCVGPLAVEELQRRTRGHAGSAGGVVLCASTLGSLVGTFATTHVLIPEFGLTRSFVGAGLLLAACGLALVWSSRRRGQSDRGAVGALLTAGLVAAGAPASRLTWPELPAGMTLLARKQSSYQTLRVVEDRSMGEPLRLLQTNEGLDSFQSVWRQSPGLLGQGFYYDAFALPAWLSRAHGTYRALVLGLGAGTTFRVLEGALPAQADLEATGVELDPAIVGLGQRYFDLGVSRPGRTMLVGCDARASLRALPDAYDLIVLDAYANQIEIPAHLCSLEFFTEARQHLAAGAWLAVNAGGFGIEDPVVSHLTATVARAFGEALAVRVPRARNWVILARRDAALPVPSPEDAARGPDWDLDWSLEQDVPGALLRPLQLPGSVHRVSDDPAAAVLTDDLNPMEVLQRRSIRAGLRSLDADA